MPAPTVLVVDDELFFRRLFSEILTEDNYNVEAVDSGDTAITRIRQGGIDLVLTDMIMPGLDGLEVLRQTRSLENPPEVILATGHATLETAIQALKNGARDYLIKPFNPEELRHLVRTCLEQRRLLDENDLLKSQIQLYQKGQVLASLLEMERLLTQTVSSLLKETGGGRGFAVLANSTQVEKTFGCHDVDDFQAKAMGATLLPQIKDLEGMRMLDAAEHAGADNWPEDVRSLCLFPLRCQKINKGILVLFNPEGASLPEEMPTGSLQFLAEQAGIGFDNAYRYQGARELIYTDDLTGLFNQRYLEIALEQEIRRAERYGLEFSVVFLDVDYFKNVNDTYGHLCGSKVLKEVAELLRHCIREVDVPFRYGGDEFTAMLVETGVEGAPVVAERIRRAIEQHTFLEETGKDCKLTVSIGYATYPKDATDKKAVLDLADRAMYVGKQVRNVTRGAGDIKG
jgi:diguanylate cyclase (GGDEF)-like protein